MQPKLIIHGGAGRSIKRKGGLEAVRRSLHTIVDETYALLRSGGTAQEAVILGCQLLEDEPRFNAGTGSVLQSDGQVRMSAGLMNGSQQSFSGVINVLNVQHPIELAQFLQTSADRILSDQGSANLARELQVPFHNPLTELRLKEWLNERAGNFSKLMAGVVAEGTEGGTDENTEGSTESSASEADEEAGRGTIGVVALDQQGCIIAGTSTGGKGFERIGRVSDCAMPAGNYATHDAGISCTGIGEDIIDECLAARIVVRVTDGMSFQDALRRSFQESHDHQRDLGAIGIDKTGIIGWGKTSDILLAAYHNGDRIRDTLELPLGYQVGTLVD
ncbi:MAG: isoaspartyl peptidase/L-asparaginase [Cyanobacteria bacterium P01_F01_bin.150]